MQDAAGQLGAEPVPAGFERIFGSGPMAQRTRSHNWSDTPLGPISAWPDALLILVNTVLANQHPMILFWGHQLIQFFNDAAIPTVGEDKLDSALGQPGDQCWAEVWPIVGEQIHQALGGHSVWKEDQLAPIVRNGRLENAWFTYSYSPVRDARGNICGVLVTELETTGRVLAQSRLNQERTRLLEVFEQAPAFCAVLRGPRHIFERINPQYSKLVGGLDVLGKPVGDAIPGITEQGYVDILDRVYRTGQPYTAADARFTLPPSADHGVQECVVDFTYQPLRETDGSISGILVLGVDMTDRNRVTQALQESERRAAMVLDSISDGFHMIDAQGRFQQFNAAGRTLYRLQGIDADALIGKMALEVFPEHQTSEVGQAIFDCLHHKKASALESFYAPWNKWFWLRNYPIPDGGVATFFQDITDKKRTEEQLLEQKKRFEFATRAARIGYWFCDLPFDKLIWDATVREQFWVSMDADVTIDDFFAILHPDDREHTRRAIDHSIGNHALYDVEYRTVAPDGRHKWIRAIGRTVYAPDGTPLRFDGVTQDITELKQAREALDAERARLSAVFENVPVGLIFTLADGTVVTGNRHADRILGLPVASGALQSFRDFPLLHESGRPLADQERPISLVLSQGGIHRGEFQYVRPDGSRMWLEIIGAPILDSQGKLVGAVDALADIDVRKRAESALVRSEKLALVGRLAASISHEINNPLESVTNLLFLIESNTLDEAARHFSRIAQEELARVSHIVTHTLRFNRQSLGWGEQKMSALLESSVAIYEGRLKNSGILLCREYADDIQVRCAGSEIRQVFANLISNAFDATRSGGKLILRARDRKDPRTGLPGVRVTIADSGQGIPPSFRTRLFEPFFTTKGDNGTGLGLWVSREILSKHNATIRIKSRTTPGASGTVLSIWFPASNGEPLAPLP